jgi:deoxyribodipyrimidine photo-lyase
MSTAQHAKLDERRIHVVREQDPQSEMASGPIIYWMNRDMRVDHNWAFFHAESEAVQCNRPLVVIYNLEIGFLGGGLRQHIFKLQGLREIATTLSDRNIPFFLTTSMDEMCQLVNEHSAPLVVTDFFPLRISQQWMIKLQKKTKAAITEVDAHNVVPVRFISQKEEFAAYTLRPKINNVRQVFLDEELPIILKQMHSDTKKYHTPDIDWQQLEAGDRLDNAVAPVEWARGGTVAGHETLQRFIEERLKSYDEDRNDPTKEAQSDLSPWLHYGNISAQYVAQQVDSAIGRRRDDKEAFLEELIVRRELSDNYCLYNEQYDSPEGYADWAKKTHTEHASDIREHLYTKAQFEAAETHDDLWNAAQREMMTRGKMHGYMRMYWAKKILEWTPDVETAHKICIYLNDKYQLDGRDPNGYAGIAWSLGGVHDRAWFERPIFGKIRYMNANGARRKFDVDAYIARWLT